MQSMGRYGRKNNRLKARDYSVGVYYVTLRSTGPHALGICRNGRSVLNPLGLMIQKTWRDIPKHYENVMLDTFIVMPDHLHGILVLRKTAEAKSTTLSMIIKAFKIVSRKACQDMLPQCTLEWQRSFHDHVIKSKKELNEIRKYIRMNPLRWKERQKAKATMSGSCLIKDS
jgi:REP element-mobilizing transposase RayT